MSLYDFDEAWFEELLGGYPKFRVRQLMHGLYGNFLSVEEILELPADIRKMLAADARLSPALNELTRSYSDREQTIKYLFGLHDNTQIESVLMHSPKRSTVCISSQAGCAMACKFCATGDAGFSRHLQVGEIVEQVIFAAREAKSKGVRLDHIVYMGMGEPLANYDFVIESIRKILNRVGLSARKITLSTVGIIPGIKRLSKENLPINLAVSLHAANDDLRSELVPINKKYSLEPLIQSCAEYLATTGRRISFEWALIKNVNDSERDAKELAVLAHRLTPAAHVNLIPLNPTPGGQKQHFLPSDTRQIHNFYSVLCELGVNATVRRTRGQDINAACGQLATLKLGKKQRNHVSV